MTTYFSFHLAEWWHIAGWTMVHFLWLGTLIGIVTAIIRQLFRGAAPNVRYSISLVALALLAAAPMGITAVKAGYTTSPPYKAGVAFGSQSIVVHTEGPPPVFALLPSVDAAGQFPRAGGVAQPIALQVREPSRDPSPVRGGSWLVILNACVPYLPWVWIIGSPITLALLGLGITGTQQLQRSSSPIEDGPIPSILAGLASSLRLTKQVGIAVCDRIASPVLVGIVRPVILLPPAALTGWSPDEIEMVLLHELAHVRRWDNLINLLQRVVESLLFFHPAVWLVSRWVRSEREACCDALVVARTQRPHAYAELIVALAAPMPHGALIPSAATSAMAGGPLHRRICRILQLEEDPMLVSSRSFAVALSGLVIVVALVMNFVPSSAAIAVEAAEQEKDTAIKQSQTTNNLKNLQIALLNYEASRKAFPASASFDAQGRPLLSWRVHILPYVDKAHFDGAKLYEEFHLDEPWDSEHNRKLIARMPAIFKNPLLDREGMTNYLGVVGKHCMFDGSPVGIPIRKFIDGTSRTIALVEADADRAVEWTRPQDWEFDREDPIAGLGKLWGAYWNAAWVDSSVRKVSLSDSADEVGIQFTRDGGENESLSESNPGESTLDEEAAILGERVPGGMVRGATGWSADTVAPAHRKFPTLEEQKVADMAWRRLLLELEPINQEEFAQVRSLGYDGGLRITRFPDSIGLGILVGLHVWPTTSYADVAEILNRDDLAELAPLKYYVVGPSQRTGELTVRTGRITVHQSPPPQPANPYAAVIPRSTWHPPEMPPQPAQAAAPQRYSQSQPAPSPALFGEAVPTKIPPSAEAHTSTSTDRDNLRALRYDNRDFEYWQREWLNGGERGTLEALEAFADAGYGSQAAGVILHGIYQSTDIAQRTRKYLSRLPAEEAAPLVANLRQVLELDLSPKRRSAAIRALASMGPNAAGAMDLLTARLSSKYAEERIAAAAAIKMIVGKDEYQKHISDALGETLGITAVETDDGAWAVLPRDGAWDTAAFGKFNDAVTDEVEALFPSTAMSSKPTP